MAEENEGAGFSSEAAGGRLLGTNKLQAAIDKFSSSVDKLKSVTDSPAVKSIGQASRSTAQTGYKVWTGHGPRPARSNQWGNGQNGGGASFGGGGNGSGPSGDNEGEEESDRPPGKRQHQNSFLGLPVRAAGASAIVGAFTGYGNSKLGTHVQMSNYTYNSALGMSGDPDSNQARQRYLAFGSHNRNLNAIGFNVEDIGRGRAQMQRTTGTADLSATPRGRAAESAANMFGYANPTLGYAGAGAAASRMYMPSTSLRMQMLGYDKTPLGPGGRASKPSDVVSSIMRGTFQGRKSISDKEMQAALAPGGTLSTNLQSAGLDPEEMAPLLQVQNKVVQKGATPGYAEKLLNQAARGKPSEMRRAQKILKDRYDVPDNVLQDIKNKESVGRGRDADVHKAFAEGVETATKNLEKFSEALTNMFNNTPLGEMVGWGGGAGSMLSSSLNGMQFGASGALGAYGLMSLLGKGGMAGKAGGAMGGIGKLIGSLSSGLGSLGKSLGSLSSGAGRVTGALGKIGSASGGVSAALSKLSSGIGSTSGLISKLGGAVGKLLGPIGLLISALMPFARKDDRKDMSEGADNARERIAGGQTKNWANPMSWLARGTAYQSKFMSQATFGLTDKISSLGSEGGTIGKLIEGAASGLPVIGAGVQANRLTTTGTGVDGGNSDNTAWDHMKMPLSTAALQEHIKKYGFLGEAQERKTTTGIAGGCSACGKDHTGDKELNTVGDFIKSLSGIAGGAAGGGGKKGKANGSARAGGGTAAAAEAKALVGTKYQSGGNEPGTGMDCAGMNQFAWGKMGVKLPRTAAAQQAVSTPVKQPKPGDLLFDRRENAKHTAMYVGNGEVVESPETGQEVRKKKYDPGEWPDARRPSGTALGGTTLGGKPTSKTGTGIAGGASLTKWCIWQQKMWYPGGRTRGMEDRGSPTQNHMDHVHWFANDLPGADHGIGTAGVFKYIAKLADEAKKKFGVSSYGGYRPADGYNEHSTRRAVDFMISDVGRGTALAKWLLAIDEKGVPRGSVSGATPASGDTKKEEEPKQSGPSNGGAGAYGSTSEAENVAAALGAGAGGGASASQKSANGGDSKSGSDSKSGGATSGSISGGGNAVFTSFWDAQTASGKPMNAQTIASSYIPMGSKIQVEINGKTATGTIEDLGPAKFVYERHKGTAVFDLAEPMMEKLTGQRSNTVKGKWKLLSKGNGRTLYGTSWRGYKDGAWEVPDDEVTQVHKGEMVIEAGAAETIRSALLKDALINPIGDRKGSGSGEKTCFHFGDIKVYGSQNAAHSAKEIIREIKRQLADESFHAEISKGRK